MKKLDFPGDVLPHIVAVAVFLVVTVVFFRPAFFENRVLSQYDIEQWEGSSKALRDFRDRTGEEGLWAPSMFSGMPAYLVNLEWSNQPVIIMKRILTLGLKHPFANIFAAFVSYYIMLLAFRIKPYLAIAGALAFGLSSYMIIGIAAGHNARIGSIAFAPLVMAGIHLAFTNRRLTGLAVTALGMALHLRENHLQITYYLMIIVAAYGIVMLVYHVREKTVIEFAKSVGLLVPAVLIGAATFFGPFWAITEYSKYSMRGPSELKAGTSGLSKTYAFEFSNAITEPMTLLVPNYYGGSSSNFLVQDQNSNVYRALVESGNQQTANQLASYTSAYWGPQRLSAPSYAGAIVCFLFVVGIVFAPRRLAWWLVPVSILSVVLSWGDNFAVFNYFLFDYLPGYNKFRSVTFALIIIIFCMPLLGLAGLQNLLTQHAGPALWKRLAWPAGIVAGFCLILAVTGGFGSFLGPGEEELPAWFTSALRADRSDLLQSDAWRSFWFITLFAAALYARLRSWIGEWVFYLVMTTLMIFDLFGVDRRLLTNDQYGRARQARITATPADQQILQDDSYFRVYNIQSPFTEARTSYFHHSIGGYHGAKLRRYQDLFDSCVYRETQRLYEHLQEGRLQPDQYSAINMLNVKYFTYGPEQVFRNPAPNGPAWFVREVVRAESPTDELNQTCRINTKEQAVVDASRFDIPNVSYDSAASVTLAEFKPNLIRYETQSNADGFVVFSEIYYPEGWSATIDGTEALIYRANYVLRGLVVPAGNHTIEFRFQPKAYTVGNKVTMASSWLLLVLVVGCLGWSIKTSR
ncbi:MAG: YfhO family protein [Bacteroidota bacterium]